MRMKCQMPSNSVANEVHVEDTDIEWFSRVNVLMRDWVRECRAAQLTGLNRSVASQTEASADQQKGAFLPCGGEGSVYHSC